MKFKLPWLKDKYFLTFIGVILLFLIIKISQIGFKFSDENIYFYMGKLILEGQLPYRDFFFASPPVQIFGTAGFLGLFGTHVILLKILPIVACVVSSIFLFVIVKKKFNSLTGLIASTLYLFSFVILTTTDHSTGIHLTTMLVVISYYFLDREKYFLAGVIASLALLTRLYAAIAIIGLMIYLLIKNRKALLKFILGIAVIFIPVNLALILMFKESYLNSVFLYHLLKSAGISKLNIFAFFLKWDILLVLLSLSSLFFKNKKRLLLPFITTATIFLFYLFYADIYYLYLGLMIPFLAILGASTIHNLTEKIQEKNRFIIIILILVILITPTTCFYLRDHAQASKITFTSEITEFVKNNTSPQETIYGSFEITPLIALFSDRKIAGNYIDTNEKTFLSGIYNVENRTNELRGNVSLVIMKTLLDQNGNPLYLEKIVSSDFLLKECNLTKIYPIKKDYEDNAVIIYTC